jgi:hypothetical protein
MIRLTLYSNSDDERSSYLLTNAPGMPLELNQLHKQPVSSINRIGQLTQI